MRSHLYLSGVVALNALSLSHHGKVDITKLNPQRVAQLLRDTQSEWVEFALSEKSQEAAQSKMVSSCGDIVSSMVGASGGEKSKVSDYFHEVCTVQDTKCQNFANAVLGFLTDDSEMNREDLNAKKFCTGFWSQNIEMYAEKAAADRAAAAKMKAEAEAKRKAQEAEQREKVRLAAEEAKRKAVEARKKAQEKAKAQKLAAQKKAAEAAAEKTKKAAQKKNDVNGPKPTPTPSDSSKAPLLKKKAAQHVMASSSTFAKFERKVESMADSAVHLFDSMQARLGTTMADMIDHGNKVEPANHSVYQTALSGQAHVEARARGQAAVAQKVNEIKARINAKFAEASKKAQQKPAAKEDPAGKKTDVKVAEKQAETKK